jgi:hypothetical protein
MKEKHYMEHDVELMEKMKDDWQKGIHVHYQMILLIGGGDYCQSLMNL